MMRGADSSRRLKPCYDSDDRISKLPDSIIGHILSFLPTKDALATGILSRRWKFLWTKTISLDFCYPADHTPVLSVYGGDKSRRFIQFVNYVLLLHKPDCLNKLSLIWKRICSPFYVNAWISAAVARNVHQLFVSVSNSSLPIHVPRSLFICQVLQSLELNCKICISTEIVISFPKLESLKLISVYFDCEEAFCKLLAGCPMLNYLHIDMDMGNMIEYLDLYTDDRIVFNYVVSSTSLRHLELYVRDEDSRLQDTSLCSVELAASSLEYIKLVGNISCISICESLSSLVEANIELVALENEPGEKYDYCKSVVEAVQAFNCAKALTLSGQVIWSLTGATINFRTRFTRLTKLEVEITSCWSSLQALLKFSDCLEVLTVNKNNHYSSVDHNTSANWKKPNKVPRCLSNSLKTVSLRCYIGGYDEFSMIGYILRHGDALKLMQIRWFHGLSRDFKTNCEMVVSKFPRKSPVSEVEFLKMA